ncbi:hypothetical protein [Brevibacillus laterosporus]|nr:hypothetical protein [Brevibacillus laterosporus]
MQKLQKEIAQEGYKLTWKSKNILPAVPYEELAAYYSYLSVSKSSPVGHYFTLRESFFCLFSV